MNFYFVDTNSAVSIRIDISQLSRIFLEQGEEEYSSGDSSYEEESVSS